MHDIDFARHLSRCGAAISAGLAHYKIVLLDDDSFGVERVQNGLRTTHVGPDSRRWSMVAAEQWAVADSERGS